MEKRVFTGFFVDVVDFGRENVERAVVNKRINVGRDGKTVFVSS